jgi:hypothetical protein
VYDFPLFARYLRIDPKHIEPVEQIPAKVALPIGQPGMRHVLPQPFNPL